MESKSLKFSQNFALIKWIIKEITQVDRNYIPLTLLNMVLNLIKIYVPILILIPIINGLTVKDLGYSLKYGYIYVLSVFLLSILCQGIGRYLRSRKIYINNIINSSIHLHNFEIDYESLISNDSKKNFASALQSLQYEIGGMLTFVDRLTEITSHLLSLLFSLSLSIKLLLSVPGNDNLTLPINENILRLAKPINSIILVLFIIGITSAMTFYSRKYYSGLQRKYFESHAEIESIGSYIVNHLAFNSKNYVIYQIYDFYDFLKEKFRANRKEMAGFYNKGFALRRNTALIGGISSTVLLLLSYSLVGIKLISGAIGVSMVVTYLKSFNELTKANEGMLNNLLMVKTALPYFNDIKTFIDIKNKFSKGTLPVEKRSDNEVEFEFSNVSFKYPETDKYVLKNINLKLKMNKKHALVGPNGSGKTTFINLLCRLFDPTEGKILLNGIDIKKYDYDEYLKIFSVVFQDFKLFSMSVGENISCNDTCIKDKIVSILNSLRFSEKSIDESLLSKSVSSFNSSREYFSGGQLQKIAIARALYKPGYMAILDEPTAALDPKSEAEIYEHLNELIKNKTTLFISHRMSSCIFCQDIIVFNDGNIVERGTHKELLNSNKLYRQMWDAQSKYYK